MSSDHCVWPRCREVMHLLYFEKPLCEKHWGDVSEMSPQQLRMARAKLGIKIEVKKLKGMEDECNVGKTDSGRGDGDTQDTDYKQGHLFSPLRNF